MNKKLGLVVLGVLVLSLVANVPAETKPLILLSADPTLSSYIKTTLGDTYDYMEIDPSALVDTAVRKKILNQLPEVIIAESDYLPLLATKNIVQSVASEAEADSYSAMQRASSFYEVVETTTTTAAIKDGTVALYGYPIAAETTVVYENTKISYANAKFSSMDELYNAMLYSNDQSNPQAKKYGVGFDEVEKSMYALYYGFDGNIFSDNVVDQAHLQITSTASIAALNKINDIANVKKLTPAWSEQENGGAKQLFGKDGNLALLVGSSTLLPSITNSTVFSGDSTALALHAIPAGAIVSSMSVMQSTGATDSSLLTKVRNALRTDAFQKGLQAKGYIPIAKQYMSGSTATAFDATMQATLDLPHDPKLQSVTPLFVKELESLLKGNQNHTRAATNMEIALKLAVPLTTNIHFLPPLSADTAAEKSPLWVPGILMSLLISMSILRLRRKEV